MIRQIRDRFMYKTDFAILIFIAFLITLDSASALELANISVSPSYAWISPATGTADITISAACASNSTNATNATATIGGDGFGSILMERRNDTAVYAGSYIASRFGSYNANISCSDNNETISATALFNVSALDLNVVSVSETSAYAGNISVIKARFTFNNQSVTSGVQFSVNMLNSAGNWSLSVSGISVENNITRLTVVLPNLSQGSYNLSLAASYDSSYVYKQYATPVTIKPPVEIEILSPLTDRIYTLSGNKEIEIVARVKYNPFLVDRLYQSQFCAEMDAKKLQIKNFTYDSLTNTYKLSVDLYRTDPARYDYNLFVCIELAGIPKQKSIAPLPIQFMLPFELSLKDAKNKPVMGAKITLIKKSGDASYDECITDSSGFCSAVIYPGTYEVNLDFGDIVAVLHNVNISSESGLSDKIENVLKFDRPSAAVEGFSSIIKSAVIDFSLPYSSADILVSNIGQNANTSVFLCTQWNFDNRTCRGSWDIVSYIPSGLSKIKISAQVFSAFIIAEKDSLIIDLDDYKKEYYLGEPASLSGTVHNIHGDAVGGVAISYIFGDESGSSATDSNGFFSISAKSPAKIKDFKASVQAKKEPYVSYEKILSLKSYMKQSLALIVPSSLNVKIGEEQSVNVTVKNTGQAALYKTDIRISGIPYNWYKIEPPQAEEIKPGEERAVEIKISIPKDNCDSGTCRETYALTLLAESNDSVSSSAKFDISVYNLKTAAGSSTGEYANYSSITDVFASAGDSLGSAVTGLAVSVRSNSLAYVFMLSFIAFAAARRNMAARKKHAVSALWLSQVKEEILKGTETANSQVYVTGREKNGRRAKKQASYAKKLKDVISDPFG